MFFIKVHLKWAILPLTSLPYFYRTQVNLGSDLCVRLSLRDLCVDFTDVTLADEDTKSIPTDNANRAIQENVAMQCSEL